MAQRNVDQSGEAGMAGELEITRIPVKDPADHETNADRLDWLCEKHKATYGITTLEDGTKRVLLEFESGDRFGTNAPTTEEAIALMFKRLGEEVA